MELEAGRRIGDYELVAQVGRGGMAVVWAARIAEEPTAGLVALKIMHPALSIDLRFETMFLGEAKIAKALAPHPNICAVTSLGRSEDDAPAGLLYLAMEWVNGDSLASLMEEGNRQIPTAIALRIVHDVAKGLHAAHETEGLLGIVHRDVSPQNILLSSSTGVAKISDFGIAKIEGGPVTQAGFVKGKVRYMSPEQVFCEPVDRRTDIFALGVVLYEAITGTHPFAKATEVATLASIADAKEAKPIVIDGSDSAEPRLRDVAMKAIAKDPAVRFATMNELAIALSSASGLASYDEVAQFLSRKRATPLAERAALLSSFANRALPAAAKPKAKAKAKASASSAPQSSAQTTGSRTKMISLLSAVVLGLGIAYVLASWGLITGAPDAHVNVQRSTSASPPPSPSFIIAKESSSSAFGLAESAVLPVVPPTTPSTLVVSPESAARPKMKPAVVSSGVASSAASSAAPQPVASTKRASGILETRE